MKPYLGMGGRETGEVLAVPGQHVGAARLHSMGHHERVDGRGGTGRSQQPAGDAAMNLARGGHRADRLQDSINLSVARSAAHDLGHDHHRDFDLDS